MSYGVWHSKEGVHINEMDEIHEFGVSDDNDETLRCLDEIDGSSV